MPSSLSKGTEPSSMEQISVFDCTHPMIAPMVQRSLANCTAENASQAITAGEAKAAAEMAALEKFLLEEEYPTATETAEAIAESQAKAAASNAKAADEMAALEKFLLEEEYPKIKIAAELTATEKFLLGEEYDKVSRHTAKAALAEAKIAEELAATEKFLLGGDYEIVKGACGRARVQRAY